ncbi:MAG: biosynthetic arginine decarboxylase, partial [Gammaproteobacteria bacterium]|nr:biosynthetic arginine decarboxylase [Gammaproteobacteria bacterium]
ARAAYSITHWGNGYFDVGADGHVQVIPRPGRDATRVDLRRVTDHLEANGLSLPVLVRFTDILQHRVERLREAFEKAMATAEFVGGYTPAYPIKVNQQRRVVEAILGAGGVGLEAGSKPELMAVLGLVERDGVVICNGYKDREYVRLALVGEQLGPRVHIVLEKLGELELVIEEARRLGVSPRLGVRVQLASTGRGKWENSGGEKSKFGLNASGVLRVVERLREEGLGDALQLLHVHLGSQVGNIRDIHQGLQEVARFYAELHKLGVKISCVDVGGGLGVDYEGTRSRSACSINYSLQEYANGVVNAIAAICDEESLPHPLLVTESGRALTAHHAVLVTNIVDVTRAVDFAPPPPPDEDDPAVLHNLWESLQTVARGPLLETYHDIGHWLAEVHTMFNHGLLDLGQRALAERLVNAVRSRLVARLNPSVPAHREALDELVDTLADKYFCNLSIFQSLPDVWAIDQVFPVVPLQRLAERPGRRAVLHDITCDSDGRIEQYVNEEGVDSTLPLHAVQPGEPYRLGIFLAGAYQEILGDLHNLFGDTHSVNVELDGKGGYRLALPIEGDGVDDVLGYVQFDAAQLLGVYRERLDAADLDAARREDYLETLTAGLEGYTYLED